MSFALVRVKCARTTLRKNINASMFASFYLVSKSFLIIKVDGARNVLFKCVMTKGFLIQIFLVIFFGIVGFLFEFVGAKTD